MKEKKKVCAIALSKLVIISSQVPALEKRKKKIQNIMALVLSLRFA